MTWCSMSSPLPPPPPPPSPQGKCRHTMAGQQCNAGVRRRAYHILSGSVLGVFSQLEGVFSRHGGSNSRMQIARVRVPNKRLVGELETTEAGMGTAGSGLPSQGGELY